MDLSLSRLPFSHSTSSRFAATRSLQSADCPRQLSDTVFDLLYHRYLPFRLYTDFTLGSSTAQLAKQFAVSEEWVAERIEAMRLCLEKQIHLKLLERDNHVAGCPSLGN